MSVFDFASLDQHALRSIMPNTRYFISTVLTVLSPFFAAGCSEPSAPTSSAAPTSQTPAASTSSSPETTLAVGFVFGETEDVPNADPVVIEKHLRATDWNNAQQRPLLHVTRTTATGSTTMKLEGTLGTPNDDGPFRAKVIALDSDEKGAVRIVLAAESPPLESMDAALELLVTLQNDPQKIRAIAAEWPGATVVK